MGVDWEQNEREWNSYLERGYLAENFKHHDGYVRMNIREVMGELSLWSTYLCFWLCGECQSFECRMCMSCCCPLGRTVCLQHVIFIMYYSPLLALLYGTCTVWPWGNDVPIAFDSSVDCNWIPKRSLCTGVDRIYLLSKCVSLIVRSLIELSSDWVPGGSQPEMTLAHI